MADAFSRLSMGSVAHVEEKRKELVKDLMVSEHIYVNTIQIVSPDLECKHHCCKLEVMSWIVLLINLKLYRGKSYHLTSLHQHTT